MKVRRWKRFLCAGLAGVMVLSLGACGKENAADEEQVVVVEAMEKEEVHSLGFDFLGGDDVMPLSGYYGPYVAEYSFDGQSLPSYLTDDVFESLSGCGLNMLHYSGANYQTQREMVYELLDLGNKHNVGIFVTDQEVTYRGLFQDDEEKDLQNRAALLTRYCDYPSFCGVYVIDEPGAPYYHPQTEEGREIADLVAVSKALNKLDVVPSINLLPPVTEADYEAYQRYVEEYCSTCEPRYLSYDYYPYYGEGTKELYFWTMDTIRKYAEEYDIPFWSYIQCGNDFLDTEHESAPYAPTEGQLHWNVNTTLAYGAKGIEYFMAIQPSFFTYTTTGYDFQRTGLIGAWGNKTQWWYYVQNVNKQIQAIDSVLMNSAHKGVIVTGEDATQQTKGLGAIIEGDSWRELKSVEGNTLIGCFNYQGKTALYVVNFEEEYAQKVTLNLQDSYNMSVTQDAEVYKVNTNQLILDLKAGEGALVVFD